MRMLLLLLVWLVPGAAIAADEAPLTGPRPAWVAAAIAPPAEPTEATAGQGAATRLADIQWRYDGEGDHGYQRSLLRINAPEALAEAGTVTLQWHPGTQRLTVHRVAILRGGETIDVLARGGFTVLRREAGLERRMIDGALTATLQIPDLRVGDTIELETTVTTSIPALRGRAQGYLPLLAPVSADRVRFLASWPSSRPMKWKAGDAFPRLRETRRGGETTIGFDETGFAANVYPESVPGRFLDDFAVQVSDTPGWQDLSAGFAELYAEAVRLAPDSSVRAEARRIAEAVGEDPVRRAEAALALVQKDVRYVFDGTGLGGYVPVHAEEVWASRYGDCKGKTVLLMALLGELGIEARAALVSSGRGDGVDQALPMAARFDHVVVRAQIGGRTYWLDGTRMGDDRLDRLEALPFRWALPLSAPGSALERIPRSTPDEPLTEMVLEYDLREGVWLPMKVKAELVMRGEDAADTGRSFELMSAADRQAALRAYWTRSFSGFEIEETGFTFDPAEGEARFTMRGTGSVSWERTGGGQTNRFELGRARLGHNFAPQRRPGPWSELPVAIDGNHYLTRYSVLLPYEGKDFLLEGADTIDQTIGPAHYRRSARLSGGRVAVEAVTRVTPGEISYGQAKADDLASDDVYAKRLFVRVPLSYRPTEAERREIAARGGQPAEQLAEQQLLAGISAKAEAGDLAGALADLTAAIDSQPRPVNLLLVRSQLRLAAGEEDKADADLDRALALDPQNEFGMLARAGRLSQQNRNEDALLVLDRLILIAPNNPNGYAARGELRMQAGRLDAALADFEIAAQLEPENDQAWLNRVRVLSTKGERQKALEAAEEMVRLFPENWVAHALHGNVLATLERTEEAKAALARSIAIEENADAYATRAVFDLSGSPEARLHDLLAAIRIDGERILPPRVFKAVLAIDGAYDRLHAAYQEQRSEADPNGSDQALGMLYEAAGRHDDYVATLDRQIAAEPRSAMLLNNRCWSRATRGVELDRALADCEAAIAIGRAPAFLDSRAMVHLRRGDLDAALADYDAALALAPRLPASLYGRGIVKLRRGDKAGGEADLAAAAEASSDIAAEFAEYGIEP